MKRSATSAVMRPRVRMELHQTPLPTLESYVIATMLCDVFTGWFTTRDLERRTNRFISLLSRELDSPILPLLSIPKDGSLAVSCPRRRDYDDVVYWTRSRDYEILRDLSHEIDDHREKGKHERRKHVKQVRRAYLTTTNSTCTSHGIALFVSLAEIKLFRS